MSVSGQWVNSFGSTVWLEQQSNGNVFGVYSSSTGSSGVYWVVGVTDPNPPQGTVGQSLAFCVFWRAIEGGKGDPSWHYVSGFSGQLVTLNGVPTLSMVHDMVATAPFVNVVPKTGNYLDKLLYTPAGTAKSAPQKWPPKFYPPETSGNIGGSWVCVQDPTLSLTITVEDQNFGYVTGSLQVGGNSVAISGFTDTYASVGGVAEQGLTLSALLHDGHSVTALAGSLNIAQDTLSLSWLESAGTAPASTWIQTRLRGLDFRRA